MFGRNGVSSEGFWTDARIPIDSEINLLGQECGKEREYRVIAFNKAGDLSARGYAQAGGQPSNTVMAVL